MQELLREHYEQSASVGQSMEASTTSVQPPPIQQPIQPPIPQITEVRGQMHPIYRLVSRYQPPEFRGTIDPLVALKWLEVMEEAMTMFTMSDQEKVKYATYLLKGDVKAWWRLMGTTRSMKGMSWIDFKQMFNEEYKLIDVMRSRTHKFFNLKQGSTTIREYSTKFNPLVVYALGVTGTIQVRMEMFV